jgi:hypothetical protein
MWARERESSVVHGTAPFRIKYGSPSGKHSQSVDVNERGPGNKSSA